MFWCLHGSCTIHNSQNTQKRKHAHMHGYYTICVYILHVKMHSLIFFLSCFQYKIYKLRTMYVYRSVVFCRGSVNKLHKKKIIFIILPYLCHMENAQAQHEMQFCVLFSLSLFHALLLFLFCCCCCLLTNWLH